MPAKATRAKKASVKANVPSKKPLSKCKVAVEKMDLKLHYLQPIVLVNPLLDNQDRKKKSEISKPSVSVKRKQAPIQAASDATEPVAKKATGKAVNPRLVQPAIQIQPLDIWEATSDVSIPIFEQSCNSISPQPTPDDDVFLCDSSSD